MDNNNPAFINPVNKLKKWALLFVIGIVLLIAFIIAKNSSFIVVQLESPSTTPFTIELTDPAGKVKQVKSSATQKRIRVGVGNYGINIKEGDKSYFEAVKTKGFLRSTNITPKTQPEKQRIFVGNNPNLCMQYLVSKLVSFPCSDRFENIGIHVPASATTPTYVLKNPNKNVGGFVEGMVKNGLGIVVLVKQPGIGDSEGKHTIFTTDDSLGASNVRDLSDLNPDTSYLLATYKDGVLAYSLEAGKAYYYQTLSSKPETIELNKPKDSSLSAASLSAHNGSLAILYGQPASPAGKNKVSEIHYKSTGSWQVMSFKNDYTKAVVCGTNMLCMIANETMDVYRADSTKPTLLYSINNVIDVENAGGDLLIVRSSDILRFNPEKRSGSVDYSFGDYKFAGIKNEPSGYILSVTNSKGKKVALSINSQLPNEDSVDKRVSQLLSVDSISDISAYGRFIYISPNVGPLVFVQSTGEYGYEPALVKQRASEINQAVSKVGFDQAKFTIINTVK
jgi:hypothetical protein